MSNEAPPPPQTPKGRSGCLIALYIVLGIGTLLVITAGIGTWLFLRSERGQKLIEVATNGIDLARKASQAPGTDALRKAGCSQAMVIPTSQVLKLVGEFGPDVSREMPESLRDGTLVMCQLATKDDAGPDCAAVARIYAAAAPQSPERFGVIVQNQRGRQAKCQGSYARDGSFLGSLDQR